MLFSSYAFLIFLMTTSCGFFLLSRTKDKPTKYNIIKIYLVFCSVFYYAYWGINDLLIVFFSVLFNFTLGRYLSRTDINVRKHLIFFAIVVNLGIIAYFKYANFIVQTVSFFTRPIPSIEMFLPLGISFFTFQQIAYIVDCYRGKSKQYSFWDYTFFVMFFPQLVAGPIVSHGQIIPQLGAKAWSNICWRNIGIGLSLFSFGLFKKVFLADHLAQFADAGFGAPSQLGLIDAWVCTLSYTCQLYFDFSGYCDMALGAALLFGIHLPLNFNSPYKAESIQKFWGCWNMTLGHFFRDYLFQPMGGFSRNKSKQFWALFLNMLFVGLWHGASWLFVLWGALHGLALIAQRIWRKSGFALPNVICVAITFLFVHFALVLFRGNDLDQVIQIFMAMLQGDLTLPSKMHAVLNPMLLFKASDWFPEVVHKELIYSILLFSLWLIFFTKNTNSLLKTNQLTLPLLIKAIAAFLIGTMFISGQKEFIYFVF